MFIFLNLLNSEKANKSDFNESIIDLSPYKNAAVVSTVSVCFAQKNVYQISLNFGLFLVENHLNEDQATIFTLPENLLPNKNMVYFTLASTDGNFCANCNIDTEGVVRMGHTPSVAKYFVGQCIYSVRI